MRAPGAAWLAVMAALALAGCAGKRLEGGVFYSPKGYRIAVPGPDWAVAPASRADLELRHREAPVGMVVNATCARGAAGRRTDVLTRHLLFGLRDRTVLEQGEVPVNGRISTHTVIEGRPVDGSERVRLETYLLRDDRCVVDFLYAAPPALFETWRPEFQRFVESFAMP